MINWLIEQCNYRLEKAILKSVDRFEMKTDWNRDVFFQQTLTANYIAANY